MSNFINTIDSFGDAIVSDSFIDRSITEFKDDVITYIGGNAFYTCSSLKKVICPNVRSLYGQCLRECSNLQIVDVGPLTKLSEKYIFYGSNKMKAFVIRNETLCILSDTIALSGTTLKTDGIGYIYVPRALVEEYTVATNWTTYADRFRALEDYTVDGTITGELDESKI